MLLKFALIIGCEFVENVTFEEICPKNIINAKHSPRIINDVIIEDEEFKNDGQINILSEENWKKQSKSNYTQVDSQKINNITKEDYRFKIESSDDLEMKEDGTSNEEWNLSGKSKEDDSCEYRHNQGQKNWSHLSKSYVGAYAHFNLTSTNPTTASPLIDYEQILKKLHSYPFDILVGCDGRRNTLNDNFTRKEFRGKLAIAVTANFINNHTLAEAQIPEISGISYIYHQEMFK